MLTHFNYRVYRLYYCHLLYTRATKVCFTHALEIVRELVGASMGKTMKMKIFVQLCQKRRFSISLGYLQ